jgi:plasmid stabilization system protein ParE
MHHRLAKLLLLIGIGLLAACATSRRISFKTGAGDAGEFILRHAAERGAQPNLEPSMPRITNAWRYNEDEFGVEIRLQRDDYPALEELLRLALGEPRLGPNTTVDQGRLGVYRLTPHGGALQFGYDAERAFVIIVRPLSEAEFSEHLIRALQHLPEER